MEKRLICITGADGSGKSTACAQVRAHLEERLGPGAVQEVSVWDCLRSGLAFQSKREVEKYLADLDGPSRTLFIFHAMSRALQLAMRARARILLLNGYWYKYAVSEIGFGVPEALVLGAARGFPLPERTYCLDIEPETAWIRRQAATGYEQGPGSKGDDAERFIGFQSKLREIWLKIEGHAGGWNHLSALEEPGLIAERIAREVLP